ncbi:hypothetical protein [Streptomyces sp. NPDC057460]|uniref:hypothetical protein n=1 Tax=Streptomyces sp. NPDC057460 TaxID=3346141 RepID=UPI0036CD9F91
MTGSGQLQSLLDKITAREQAVASEAEQVRAHIDELAGRLRGLDQEAGASADHAEDRCRLRGRPR